MGVVIRKKVDPIVSCVLVSAYNATYSIHLCYSSVYYTTYNHHSCNKS